jgi:hypothetical protein
VTLRDELRADERHGRAPRAPNIRWKELLGLKKAPKKQQAAADAGTSTDAAHTVRRISRHLGRIFTMHMQFAARPSTTLVAWWI